MKNIIITFLVCLLTFLVSFSFTWCYILEKNQKMLLDQMNYYQKTSFEKTQEMEKEIRLLQQDILVLSK